MDVECHDFHATNDSRLHNAWVSIDKEEEQKARNNEKLDGDPDLVG